MGYIFEDHLLEEQPFFSLELDSSRASLASLTCVSAAVDKLWVIYLRICWRSSPSSRWSLIHREHPWLLLPVSQRR